jgi:sporulation protein YlmC with PRC-barrel domain
MKTAPIFASLAALSAAAILLATPALAQQTTPEPSTPPTALEQPEASGGAAATATAPTTDLMDKHVWSSDGKDLGTISKVNLGANGAVESIHVGVGTFFGLGGKTVKIEAADFSLNNDRVELKMNTDAAKALPEIKA